LFGASDGLLDLGPETARMRGVKSSYNALNDHLPTEMTHIFTGSLRDLPSRYIIAMQSSACFDSDQHSATKSLKLGDPT
jgi:hypothetical protein